MLLQGKDVHEEFTPAKNLSTGLRKHPAGVFFDEAAAFLEIDIDELQELCAKLKIQARSVRVGQKTDFVLDEVQMRELLSQAGFKYPSRAQRIAMMMCKGGVGKTTVSFYLAQRLAHYGARVLVVDTDPQGNLTAALQKTFSTTRITESTPVIMDVLAGKCLIEQTIQTLTSNLHFIPSTALNSLLEKKLLNAVESPVLALHRKLAAVDHDYDYILLDTAPSLNLINASIMYCSDQIIMPLFMSEFSLLGLEQTLSEVKDLQRSFKFSTEVHVLVNKFNHREKLSFGYLGQLAQEHRSLVFKSIVRSSSQLQQSIATGNSLFVAKKSIGKEDFDCLAQEILKRKGHRP